MPSIHTSMRMAGTRIRGLVPPLFADEPRRAGDEVPAVSPSRAAVVLGSSATVANIAKTATLLQVSFSAPARLRIYATDSQRVADLDRLVTAEAPEGSGLMFEFLATGALLSANLAPAPVFSNGDNTPAIRAYYTMEPTVAGSEVIATLTYLPTES